MQKQLPGLMVTYGCIYVSANIKEPGVIKMHGDIFRIVYGVRNPNEYRPMLEEIANDLKESGITGIISDNIQRDCLQKFSYVSPMAACGLYYDCTAEAMQKQGEIRECFVSLIREIKLLANAMGVFFTVDIIPTNLDILDGLSPTASISMQRDFSIGKQSEIDGLIFEVVRIGNKIGVPLLNYEKITRKFGFKDI
ncbi:2-dehydropantoate 2-reductase [Clostridium formicaceticum]|uniref:2-dehydropantoate 2-reductase n=2 Tax=Clostridium formicaceticum TaxID=1497 RepID=A0AAC9RME4_9CLOT|nr:ketopantoate reductase C-terminal domain-containing protein [Clostridium formicaceticum]AOY78079.1 hypothetical protein BJL90_20755 [Clostridium formicaceticum]ARE88721.1 2-dehydropantoate 2-reductase [Clostridium formicaceticum]